MCSHHTTAGFQWNKNIFETTPTVGTQQQYLCFVLKKWNYNVLGDRLCLCFVLKRWNYNVLGEIL
jgi:hypothetical protein